MQFQILQEQEVAGKVAYRCDITQNWTLEVLDILLQGGELIMLLC